MKKLSEEFTGKKLEGTNEKSISSFKIISGEEFKDYRKEFKIILFQS